MSLPHFIETLDFFEKHDEKNELHPRKEYKPQLIRKI